MKLPSLLHHIFNANSRKVGFGWWVFIVATYGAFIARLSDAKPVIDASNWLLCVGLASGLIGGGTIADAWIEKAKGGLPKEVTPSSPPSAEGTPK